MIRRNRFAALFSEGDGRNGFQRVWNGNRLRRSENGECGELRVPAGGSRRNRRRLRDRRRGNAAPDGCASEPIPGFGCDVLGGRDFHSYTQREYPYVEPRRGKYLWLLRPRSHREECGDAGCAGKPPPPYVTDRTALTRGHPFPE